MNGIALGAILFTLVVIGIVCLVLLKTFKMMADMLLPKEVIAVAPIVSSEFILEPSKPKLTLWEKLLSLRPMSEEKDLIMEHEYDGIVELDNPTPAWFMWLFYGTIIFAFVYLLNYHVFKLGKLQDEEYVVEMKQADVAKKAFLAKSANRVDENSVKLTTDAEVLKAGSALFIQNCVACHGDHAQGIVGPNLTDEYWLHGSKIGDLFKTIKYGVPDKGMISWEKQLSPKQISEVANYIKSLKDTHPANPKAPQGDKET
ncbi:MAG: c-type cytochrome [Bacteroidetes bacterium]|nr:c-type cytochrome [Bacteroidota bacterium]MBU1372484.1 c-type cytochrome [Bacteroidota bacterium]MBU1485107.1 c-type cytochrome [Bacteroidota bacterium]MBU1761504.1 c-type cytochrome [Bacteroidota bacterium]MBU2045116.1 c-type cytochrome [Bacteroidota bacterium]